MAEGGGAQPRLRTPMHHGDAEEVYAAGRGGYPGPATTFATIVIGCCIGLTRPFAHNRNSNRFRERKLDPTAPELLDGVIVPPQPTVSLTAYTLRCVDFDSKIAPAYRWLTIVSCVSGPNVVILQRAYA